MTSPAPDRPANGSQRFEDLHDQVQRLEKHQRRTGVRLAMLSVDVKRLTALLEPRFLLGVATVLIGLVGASAALGSFLVNALKH